jgi:hypothetical protein
MYGSTISGQNAVNRRFALWIPYVYIFWSMHVTILTAVRKWTPVCVDTLSRHSILHPRLILMSIYWIYKSEITNSTDTTLQVISYTDAVGRPHEQWDNKHKHKYFFLLFILHTIFKQITECRQSLTIPAHLPGFYLWHLRMTSVRSEELSGINDLCVGRVHGVSLAA